MSPRACQTAMLLQYQCFLVTYLVVLNELGVPTEKICDALLNHPKLLIVMRYCDEVRSMLES